MKKILGIMTVLAVLAGICANAAFVSGTLNGTGANIYVGIGFIPDWVKVQNLEQAAPTSMVWSVNMRSLEQIEGVKDDGYGTLTDLTDGNGIRPYRGGDVMSAASTVYIKHKQDDQRAGEVTQWKQTSGRTGYFDSALTVSTYVGEGSRVNIDGLWYTIVNFTNSATDYSVMLNESVVDGDVFFLGPMYDYAGCAAGDVMPAGFMIAGTNSCNISGDMLYFEAGTYER